MNATWIVLAVYGVLFVFIMLWPERKVAVHENILKFRTHNHHIRTWVERSISGPPWEADAANMEVWVAANKQRIDSLNPDQVCRWMCDEFPRISAIECLDGYGYHGSLLYPRWP